MNITLLIVNHPYSINRYREVAGQKSGPGKPSNLRTERRDGDGLGWMGTFGILKTTGLLGNREVSPVARNFSNVFKTCDFAD